MGYIRWFYYYKILSRLKTKKIEYIIENGLSHNLTVFDKFPLDDFVMRRTSYLINSISSIELLNNKSNFLVIGPRTESDILKLKANFQTAKIEAIDIISYSPWIKLQDMHSIQFDDNYFDCVMSGWVMPYSINQKLAIKEMIRILKNDGIIAIGLQHTDKVLIDEYQEGDPRLINPLKNKLTDINSVKDIENILLDLNVSFETLICIDAPLKNEPTTKKIKLTGSKATEVIYLAKIKK